MKMATEIFNALNIHLASLPDRIRYIATNTKFRQVDISFWDELEMGSPLMEEGWRAGLRPIKKALDESGILPIQAHSPKGDPLASPAPELHIRKTIRSIECAAELGIPAIVVHPGAYPSISHDAFISQNRDFFQKLIPTAESCGIEILIENIGTPMDPHYLHNAHELLQMIDAVDHPLFFACWDTGHANHNECDPYESVTTLGGRLHGLHVNDNLGRFDITYKPWRLDMHTIPLFGSINFDSLMHGLLDISYKGYFTFEVDVPRRRPNRIPFSYDGRLQERLMDAPLPIIEASMNLLYEAGAHILRTYGCFEEDSRKQ